MESLNKTPTQRVEFRYDPQGRRIQKKVSEARTPTGNRRNNRRWKTTQQHHYVYDGRNLIAELDAQKHLVRTHLLGLDLSGSLQGAGGVGGLLQTTYHQRNEKAIPLIDGNGNVVQYFDTLEANPIARFAYDPVGNMVDGMLTAEGSFPFQFSTGS